MQWCSLGFSDDVHLPQIHGHQKLLLFGEQLFLDSFHCMIVVLIVMFCSPWKSYTIVCMYLLPTISEMLYEVVRILRQIYNKFNRNLETSDMVCFVCGRELHLKWRLALFIKNIQLFKNIFRQFFCHLQFWIIQSTKLNLKRTTECWLDKTDNSNRTMYAFTRKVLNWHDKVDD